MNDITPTGPAPRKSSGTIIIILVILIILVAGIALSMRNTPTMVPTQTTDTTSYPESSTVETTPTTTQTPDQEVQNIDSLNASLDSQQFEGTSSTFQ